jgi:hypothetical protein
MIEISELEAAYCLVLMGTSGAVATAQPFL